VAFSSQAQGGSPVTLIEIVVLAVIQGLTEFLPVSSSGHLVVANALMEAIGRPPAKDLIEVSIVLHLGTLAAVLVFYRQEIWALLTSDRRVIGLLVFASVPAAVVGLVLLKVFDGAGLENPLVAGLMFPVTAAGLLWISRRENSEGHYRDLPLGRAMWVGILQALAILPGISRSGATIVGGLSAGLSRNSAATFSFLLAIPVIGGGGLLKAVDAWQKGSAGTGLGVLVAGFLVSMLVGLVALRILIGWLRAGQLYWFAYYLIPLGIAVVAWQAVS
jgi:undecaprenyl-diphosphatase